MDDDVYAAISKAGETVAVFAFDPSSGFEWNGVLGTEMRRIGQEDYKKFKRTQKEKPLQQKVKITFQELKSIQQYLDSKEEGASPEMQKVLRELGWMVKNDLRNSPCLATEDGMGKHDWKYKRLGGEPHECRDPGYYACQRKGCNAMYME